MWFLRFADQELERRVALGCVRGGVLLKRGAYNFPSLAHERRDVDETLKVVRDVLAEATR
jgi:glutamate-1-semialdehyde aminotransferase